MATNSPEPDTGSPESLSDTTQEEDQSPGMLQKLVDAMLSSADYSLPLGMRRGRPPFHITMRIYSGVRVSDTLDIRSNDVGSLWCIREYAERRDAWVESSTVRDPDLSKCHRLWIADALLHLFLGPGMLPIVFMRFIEEVLGYERVYAGKSMWMFERRTPFRGISRQRDGSSPEDGRSSEDG